jgi:hypothetical protein
MNYRFNSIAKDELRSAITYYESCRVGLGGEFLFEISVGIQKVLEAPYRW